MHSEKTSFNERHKKKIAGLGIISVLSVIWLAIRSGTKPSRLLYPCQRAALSNLQLTLVGIAASIPSFARVRSKIDVLKPIFILVAIMSGSLFLTGDTSYLNVDFVLADDDYTRVPIDLVPSAALASENVSDLFFIQNASDTAGNMDSAVQRLIGLMDNEDLHFYDSLSTPTGLVGSDDVILIKYNGQWNYRGGTNTDLIKSVINAILNHPSGFTGEIVIADNGQGLGDLDFTYANAFNRTQALLDVVNSFDGQGVSAYLWDNIRSQTVDDYDEGDTSDGYVLSDSWDSDTEIYVSYPKFRTEHGSYISMKNGVWDSIEGFDSDRLKIINMPVMKTHFRYRVTGCIKHYMGVPKGHIVPSVDYSIPHEHFSIALGGMATLMVETRAPVLNILDMTWVNAHPLESSSRRGPWSTYSSASFTDIIGASQDPVALDYYSSKNILCATAEYLNYTDYSSLDPDYAPLSDQYYGSQIMDESFHNYLTRSMNVLKDAGFQATMDPDEMNVFVAELDGNPVTTETPTTPTDTLPDGGLDIGLLVILPISAVLLVATIVAIKRRSKM
ncbi:MAG: DUF362 domain-containing protein [Candidatus Thorarchaeota archaeon]|jgi:hypothetical protein